MKEAQCGIVAAGVDDKAAASLGVGCGLPEGGPRVRKRATEAGDLMKMDRYCKSHPVDIDAWRRRARLEAGF